jgi:hypothetical protein
VARFPLALAGVVRWLSDVIPATTLGLEPPVARSLEVVQRPPAEMCLACRGAKLLCGKPRCPIIVQAQALVRQTNHLNSERISGASPPGLFVGRFGYPKVYIGPMVPPFHGDTSILDLPELWMGRPVEEILDYRFALIRGNRRAHVLDAQKGDRFLTTLQEMAMAAEPVDAELELTKRPRSALALSDDSQPFGPSAPLRNLRSATASVDRRIEQAYYDRDLNAAEASWNLYRNGVLVTRVQRAFSAGMFGRGPRRKLVPTRWSITAVDSTLSLRLMEEVKHCATVDAYLLYQYRAYENRYVGLLLPEPWKFEWIEAWFPETTWNLYGVDAVLMGDYEEHAGRSTYARIGGCYYATRLAAAEHLSTQRRQAGVVLLREIHPGYLMPLGVWNVREAIRSMFRKTPRRFDNLRAAVRAGMAELTIPLQRWMEASALLQRAFYQRKLTEYKSGH